MLKKGRLLLLALVAMAALVASSAAPTAVGVDTTAYRDAVTTPGVKAHLTALQAIADANGDTRAVETPGYDASVAYVVEQLEDAGYEPDVQDFTYAFFGDEAPPMFRRVSPGPPVDYVSGFEEDFLTMEWSGDSVQPDPAPAALIAVDIEIPSPGDSDSGCEAADFDAFPDGAVALIQRGFCSFRQKVTNAEDAGASGVVIFNEGNDDPSDDRLGVVNGTLDPPATPASIPAIGTSFAVGEELVELVEAGPVSVVLDIDAGTIERETQNVIAETEGGRADRVVLVGGHLDSVPEGPGINDNGSGVATILELAIQMAELDIAPTNRVRFAFWGGEEEGLNGSQFYVDNLPKSELKNVMLNINLDMVGSPNFVRFVYDGDGSAFGADGPSGSATMESVFNDFFASQGLAFAPTEFDGRSDYFAFINAGIAAGGLFTGAEDRKTAAEATAHGGTAGVAYDSCYHQACDDIDNVSDTALSQMSDAAAHATLLFAMSNSSVNGTDKASNRAKANLAAKLALDTK